MGRFVAAVDVYAIQLGDFFRQTFQQRFFPGDVGAEIGCGAGGGVINFVRLLYGLDFRQACIRLESDFGLVGVTDSASPELSEKAKKRNAEKAEYKALKELFVRYRQIIWDGKPKAQGEPLSPEFNEAIKELPHIENRLRELEEKWK